MIYFSTPIHSPVPPFPFHPPPDSPPNPPPYPSLTPQRTPLDHDAHHLKERIRRRHGRMLRVRIVSRRHLDDVRGDEIDAFQAAEDGPEFARGPPARFGGACCGGDCCEKGGGS